MAVTLESHWDDLELSVRVSNGLAQVGVQTVAQVLALDPRALLRQRNFGKKSLDHLRARLADHGLRLLADETPQMVGTPDQQVKYGEALKKIARAAQALSLAMWEAGNLLSGGGKRDDLS